METFYVFQHSLACVTDGEYHSMDDILVERNYLDVIDPSVHTLIGDPCLFKLDQMAEGLIYGRLTADLDIQADNIGLAVDIRYLEFPIAEYLFTIHDKPIIKLDQTYDKIGSELNNRQLNAVFHPILVFPKGLPSSLEEPTTIEIWVATDADIDAPEYRLSDDLKEALPRTSFNFYTW